MKKEFISPDLTVLELKAEQAMAADPSSLTTDVDVEDWNG